MTTPASAVVHGTDPFGAPYVEAGETRIRYQGADAGQLRDDCRARASEMQALADHFAGSSGLELSGSDSS